MKLAFSGAPEVAAPRNVVWHCLMDPDFVAQSAPGVERIDRVDGTHYAVISAFDVGSMRLRFYLEVELSDLEEPSRATMTARGKAPGSAVDVIASIALEQTAPGRTVMRWNSESELSGTITSVGGRLLEGAAKKLTGQFWDDFARRVPTGS